MKNTHPILTSLIPLVEGIAKTFGENCEVVLHDFTNYNASIITISNGHITGRQPGAPITNLGLKMLKQGYEGRDLLLNYKNNSNGKYIKSSSILIRDENDKVIGCLCINYDVTQMRIIEDFLKAITHIEQNENESKQEEKFPLSISDLMDQIIQEAIKDIGKPIHIMNKEERIRFVILLDQMGLFLIKGAVQQIAEILDVSKYTIYNYLEKKDDVI
jgi:predicted transcriptional regulator YheO